MEASTVKMCSKAETMAAMRTVSAGEVLRRSLRTIDVPDSTELVLSPSHPELGDCFAKVGVRSYEDLQMLGFVPRKLAQEKVRGALSADDDEVYRLASSSTPAAAAPCKCEESRALERAPGNGLRAAYNALRKRHNPALARLFSDHYGTAIAWDDPAPAIARRWLVAIEVGAVSAAVIALFSDIKIHRNATLRMDAYTDSLFAHDIMIHRTGRLVQQGSYLKIWANSVTSFLDIASAVVNVRISQRPSPWLVDTV